MVGKHRDELTGRWTERQAGTQAEWQTVNGQPERQTAIKTAKDSDMQINRQISRKEMDRLADS